MSISENNYYLKDGLLYKLTGASMYRVSSEDVISDSSKSALLIDDTYFFYIGMENISTSAKKLHAIAANYLNVLFPADMVKEYGVFQNSGKTIIYVINQTLIDIISENAEIFAGFKKISTPFLEQCIKYNEFIFSDGSKKYRLSENMVTLIEDKDVDCITAKDLFETMQTVKYSMILPGIVRKSAMKLPLAAPAAVLAVIYLVMISLVMMPDTFNFTGVPNISAYDNILAFAKGIFINYVWAFELVSLLLTIVIAGLSMFRRRGG